ncbi:TPA: hypothetical protein DDW35_12515 [Candidatus Sumerlaeota bacterium]|jgi:uncharacterized protein YgiM (DUF1202 family)|nr:hypothetical protein [Candidatus Sumerlaeota bacterium]
MLRFSRWYHFVPKRRRALFLTLLLLAVAGIAYAAATMNVISENGVVRATPDSLGKAIGTIKYGTPVSVVSQNGDWYQVSISNTSGWMHKSTLTAKQVLMKSGTSDAQTAASSGENQNAAFGFTKEVEGQYKQKNPNLRFDQVNRMEQYKIDDETKREFLNNGNLSLGKGGAQ